MKLAQKTAGRGLVEFDLQDEAVVIRQKKGSWRAQTRFDYRTLLPDPDEQANSRPGLLVGSIFVALVMTCLLALWRSVPDDGTRQFVGIMLFLFGCCLAVLLWIYRNSRFDHLIYYFRNGAHAFSISRRSPDEDSVRTFIAQLSNQIRNCTDAVSPMNSPTNLAAEIARLGDLKTKGLLTDEEFTKAKTSLLEHLERGNREMGFHS